MNAAVSGRAGSALIDDAGRLFRLDADTSDEPHSIAPHQAATLFRDARDVRFLTDTSLGEVRKQLQSARDQEEAVHLLLIALDPATRETTRRMAVEELEELLADEEVWRHLEHVFWSKPLPRSVNARVPLRIADSRLRRLLAPLDDQQTVIARVHAAWQTAAPERFGEYSSDEVYAFFAHEGIIRKLVQQVAARVPILQPDLSSLAQKTGIPQSELDSVWNSWGAAIAPRHRVTTVRVFIASPGEPLHANPAFLARPTYFAAADAELEAMHPVDFDAALAANLLFSPRIVIPHTMFFSSSGIRQHLESNAHSLLEAAIQDGYVTIALDRDLGDLSSAHERLYKWRFISNRCDALVDRLQTAADASYSPHVFEHMPSDNHARTFTQLLSLLPEKTPPPAALSAMPHPHDLENAWAVTETFRTRVLPPVLTRSTDMDGRTLKQQLLREIARTTSPTRLAPVHTISDVLQTVGESLREGILIFWSWVSEAFRVDESERAASIFHIAGYHHVQHIFTTALLGTMSDTPSYENEVVLPPQSTLKRIPSALLLELRRGAGEDYFRALQDLHRNPLEDRSRTAVERALSAYALEINSRCAVYLFESPEVAQVRIGYERRPDPTFQKQPGLKFLAMTRFPSKIKHALRQKIGKFVSQAREPEVGPIATGGQTELSLHRNVAERISGAIP